MTRVKGQIVGSCWLLLTLNSEDYGHAFTLEEIQGIEDVFERYKEAYKGIILRSSGRRFFCSGGNLKKYRKMSRSEGIKTNRKIRNFIQEFDGLGLPTVAIVDGDCLGGGLELVSAFDHVIATPQSIFGFWQRRIGLTFGWGGGRRLLSRMTDKKLRSLSLAGSSIDARQAYDWGLVDEIAIRTVALDRAQQWLQSQKSYSQYPVEFLKSRDWKYEVKFFEKIWMNKDHQSLLKRFF